MRLKTESTYYRSRSNIACSLGYPGLCGQQILVTETDMTYCILVAPSCDHYHSLLTDVAIFSYASLNFLHLSLLVAAFSQLSSLSPTCLPFVLPGYHPAPCSLPTSNNLYHSSLFNIAILNYVAYPSHIVSFSLFHHSSSVHKMAAHTHAILSRQLSLQRWHQVCIVLSSHHVMSWHKLERISCLFVQVLWYIDKSSCWKLYKLKK